jgi:hypothetical protein
MQFPDNHSAFNASCTFSELKVVLQTVPGKKQNKTKNKTKKGKKDSNTCQNLSRNKLTSGSAIFTQNAECTDISSSFMPMESSSVTTATLLSTLIVLFSCKINNKM